MFDIKIKGFQAVYNQLRMNCNIYWQPAPISIIPNPQTCFYIDQSAIINSNQVSNESELKQLKKKVKELELENSQLKEEILILEKIKQRRGKRIVKRRKEEELDKKFKCSHFNCKKQYASALALNLHIRTKHPQNLEIKDSDQKDQTSHYRSSLKREEEYINTNQ